MGENSKAVFSPNCWTQKKSKEKSLKMTSENKGSPLRYPADRKKKQCDYPKVFRRQMETVHLNVN